MSWFKCPPWQARIQKQADAERIKRESERHQIVVDALNSIAHQLESGRQEQIAADTRKEARERLTIIGLFLTAGIYLFALCVSIYQVSLTRRSIADAEANSATQSTNTQTSLGLAKQAADAVTKQADLLRESDDTAKNTLVASSRAWVGPLHVSSAMPTADNDLDVILQYLNTGRDPGIDIVTNTGLFALPIKDAVNGKWDKTLKNFDDKCTESPGRNAGVAYPTSGFSSYALNITVPKQSVDSTVVDGSKFLAVAGCFTYSTFQVRHHSYWCFFYLAKKVKPESWSFCQTGNYAD